MPAARIEPSDDVNVDAGIVRSLDNPRDVRSARGEVVPPAAFAGPNHDLRDLVLPGKPDDCPRWIVVLRLMPTRAGVLCQHSKLVDRAVVGRQALAGSEVQHGDICTRPGG